VISPGQPVMLIVPSADVLMVEAKLRPRDIDQVRVGQPALLRFTALNQRTTPELAGTVGVVAPDVTQDPKSGANYYSVRIEVPATEFTRLDGQKIVPGMPVEAFFQTAPRTVMSFLVKPLQDQAMKAFREK
jgi:HlyD family secretion protein